MRLGCLGGLTSSDKGCNCTAYPREQLGRGAEPSAGEEVISEPPPDWFPLEPVVKHSTAIKLKEKSLNYFGREACSYSPGPSEAASLAGGQFRGSPILPSGGVDAHRVPPGVGGGNTPWVCPLCVGSGQGQSSAGAAGPWYGRGGRGRWGPLVDAGLMESPACNREGPATTCQLTPERECPPQTISTQKSRGFSCCCFSAGGAGAGGAGQSTPPGCCVCQGGQGCTQATKDRGPGVVTALGATAFPSWGFLPCPPRRFAPSA